jgi:hypothetical protein
MPWLFNGQSARQIAKHVLAVLHRPSTPVSLRLIFQLNRRKFRRQRQANHQSDIGFGLIQSPAKSCSLRPGRSLIHYELNKEENDEQRRTEYVAVFR